MPTFPWASGPVPVGGLPPPALLGRTSITVLVSSIAAAAIIFVLDTFVSLEFAVAVLYTVVVFAAIDSYSKPYVVVISAACVCLAFLSYVITHGFDLQSAASIRLFVSIFAILVTAILVSKVIATSRSLRENERKRTNLSRYFSPQLVHQIADADVPLSMTRYQPASVMFVDMIGFTAFCDRNPPETVIGMLRDLLRILSECVFERQGTIDKFTGDGLFAVFGLPVSTGADATNAASCAFDILDAVQRWNARDGRSGADAIRVAVGIHHGAVVQADVGFEKRLELTTFGDAVNIASRVEAHCRQVGASVLVTQAFIAELTAEGAGALAARFLDQGVHRLRGRAESTRLFGYSRSSGDDPPGA